MLQQQLSSQQATSTHYDALPEDIVSTLDNMAFGIAQKENLDAMTVKNNLVRNINKLTDNQAEFLVASMAILIDKSTQQNITIDDTNTQREFISFLITLYY